MRYSGVIVAREKVDYGYVLVGDDAVFRFLVASFVDRGVYVLQAMTTPITVEQVERFADMHHAYARVMSCRRCHHEHLPAMLSYVRSLPAGRRSDQLFSRDPDLLRMSEDDVRKALVNAMVEPDGYRAAIAFERNVPFLRADRRIVDVMDRVVEDSERFYLEGEDDFLRRVAEAMEAQVASKDAYLGEQINRAKSSVFPTPSPSPVN